MVGYHVVYWANTIKPWDRCMSNLTDGTIFRHVKDAIALAERLRATGCTIYGVLRVEDPTGWWESLEEYDAPHNVPDTHKLAGLSVKQIAEKLGISLNEVRRRKRAGTI